MTFEELYEAMQRATELGDMLVNLRDAAWHEKDPTRRDFLYHEIDDYEQEFRQEIYVSSRTI